MKSIAFAIILSTMIMENCFYKLKNPDHVPSIMRSAIGAWFLLAFLISLWF